MNKDMKYANPGKRFLSFLLDTVITLPIYFLFVYTGYLVGEDELFIKAFFNLLFILILITFWIIFEGQTPGQMIMKIKIIDEKSKKKIGIVQSFIRAFGYITCNLTLGIGFLFMFFDKKKRGLHDMIALTSVIDISKKEKDFN